MPIGLLAGQALIHGASTAVSQGLNILNYNRQRRDALADWNREAAYNSPAAQVGRLQDAGISPYASNAQSLVSSAPQTRTAQMQGAQVPQPINLLQVRQAAEQLRGLALDNEYKETQVNRSKLEYSIDNETLREKRLFELRQMNSTFKNTEMDYDVKYQTISNMKAQLVKLVVDTQLQEIEKLHRDKSLALSNSLRQSQISMIQKQSQKLMSEIANIDTRTSQDKASFSARMDKLIQEVQSLKLGNERQSYENYFAPEMLRQRNEIQGQDLIKSKSDAQMLQTLPPEMRYIIEKMGGDEAIPMLLQFFSKGKLSAQGHKQNMEYGDFIESLRDFYKRN